jgi:hypothetical protein
MAQQLDDRAVDAVQHCAFLQGRPQILTKSAENGATPRLYFVHPAAHVAPPLPSSKAHVDAATCGDDSAG